MAQIQHHATITRFTHYFSILHPTPGVLRVIYSFSGEYTQHSLQFCKKSRKKRWLPYKTFGLYIDHGREFRFHIGQFDEFMRLLNQNFVDPSSYVIVDADIYEPEKIDIEIQDNYILRDDQEEASEFVINGGRTPVLLMGTGTGKAQPHRSKIKIPGGWTTMGRVKVGDFVTSWDGTPAEVLGKFPQGYKQTYRVIFEDGRSTSCCLEHLWDVVDEDGVKKTLDTKQLINGVHKGKHYSVPLILPEDGPRKEENFSPYSLGFLASSKDKASFEAIANTSYLHGSFKQRLEFIQGFMDFSGDVSKNGDITATVHADIYLTVLYFLRSIGCVVKNVVPDLKIYSDTEKGLSNIEMLKIHIQRRLPALLFSDPKQKNKLQPHAVNTELTLKIESIVPDGFEVCSCISISHKDHLYVTDDFIVTHNTVTSLTSVAKRGFRFVVRVQAMYVDKWVNDIMEILKIDRSEICPIKGSDILQRATNYPESGMAMPKAFVVSISTMSSWCKLYEEDINNPRLEAYACSPSDFCQHLGVGTEIYDEAHLHPHAVYRNMCFTHVPKIIVLTATLLTKDPILRRVQSAMFPRVGRFEKIKMKRYITVHAASYQIFNFHGSKIQTTEQGQKNYSHAAFEKSIISNPKILRQYLKMITDMVLRTYFVDKAPGDTMMVFVATKRMADVVYARFKELWPEFDIRRYLQENDYPDILEPEIVITTIISGGTAIDKKDLRHVINTISIDSPNANAQVLGRLREMKHRETQNDVHFHYFYSSSIPKQVEYHRNKLELLQERVKEIKHELLDPIIP